MSRPTADLLARYARAGQECLGPNWVATLIQEAGQHAESFGVDAAELLVYLSAGVLRARLVSFLEEKHGHHGTDRWERSGAQDILNAILEAPDVEPSGPVKDHKDLHARAARMNLIIAR